MRARWFAFVVLAACSSSAPADRPISASASTEAPAAPTWTMEEFNTNVTAELAIELDGPTRTVGALENKQAPPSVEVRSIKLVAVRVENEEPRDLSPAELDTIVLAAPSLRLRSMTDAVVTHAAPNGRHFTVRDLLSAIERTERETRPHSNWLGGVDVHHIYLEGLDPNPDGTWTISWGS